MSQTAKVVLWVVVAVVVIGAVWMLVAGNGSSAPANGSPSASVSGNNAPSAPGNGSVAAGGNQAPSSVGSAPSSQDTSDASLNQDLSNIGTQMNGLSSDSASVDAGLNDQPVAQPSL